MEPRAPVDWRRDGSVLYLISNIVRPVNDNNATGKSSFFSFNPIH